MRETVADGGLPCPNCSTLAELHMSSSWHLGQVALLQNVREASADGKTLNADGILVCLVIRVVGNPPFFYMLGRKGADHSAF